MIYKQYEKPHEHYLFQWERGSKNYGIYTTDVEIAKIIRRRNNTYEFDVIFPIGCGSRKFWLFSTNYATYQSARKSFNRLLTQHSLLGNSNIIASMTNMSQYPIPIVHLKKK